MKGWGHAVVKSSQNRTLRDAKTFSLAGSWRIQAEQKSIRKAGGVGDEREGEKRRIKQSL